MKKFKKIIAIALTCLTTLSLMLTTSCSLKNPKQLLCKHVYTEETTKKATCTENGEKTLTCTKCEFVKTEIIKKTGHVLIEDVALSPTCLENGKTQGIRCSICGFVEKEQELIPATGHNLEIIPGIAPTCTSTGLTEGSYCTVCETVVVERAIIPNSAHTLVEGVCTVCGEIDYSFVENGAYVESSITSSSTLANKWIRIYESSSSTYPPNRGLQISCIGTAFSYNDFGNYSEEVNTSVAIWCSNSDAALYSSQYSGTTLHDVIVKQGDGYVDLFFKADESYIKISFTKAVDHTLEDGTEVSTSVTFTSNFIIDESVTFAVGSDCVAYELINNWYIEEKMYLYLFINPMDIIGTVTLYIALLLFGLNNRIPALVSLSPEKEKQKTDKMTPEQSLRLLKDKLDLGMITEEEYQTQRVEIISKL